MRQSNLPALLAVLVTFACGGTTDSRGEDRASGGSGGASSGVSGAGGESSATAIGGAAGAYNGYLDVCEGQCDALAGAGCADFSVTRCYGACESDYLRFGVECQPLFESYLGCYAALPPAAFSCSNGYPDGDDCLEEAVELSYCTPE